MEKELILEGRWKRIGFSKTKTYIFENIYNHKQIQLSSRQVKNVINGKDTIGHIMTRRIKNEDNRIGCFRFGNSVNKSWGRTKYKYIKERKEVE